MVYILTPNSTAYGMLWASISLARERSTPGGQSLVNVRNIVPLIFGIVAYSEISLSMLVATSTCLQASHLTVSRTKPNRHRLYYLTRRWERCVCTVTFLDRCSHVHSYTPFLCTQIFSFFLLSARAEDLYSLEKYITFSQVRVSLVYSWEYQSSFLQAFLHSAHAFVYVNHIFHILYQV